MRCEEWKGGERNTVQESASTLSESQSICRRTKNMFSGQIEKSILQIKKCEYYLGRTEVDLIEDVGGVRCEPSLLEAKRAEGNDERQEKDS